MDARKLVKMANQITGFFEAEPDVGMRLDGIAGHLSRFWDPRMRREILRHLDQGGEGMKECLLQALKAHRNRIEPSKTTPISEPAAR